MDSNKRKDLEKSYERIINVGSCIIPYEDLSDIIDINPVVFGTTKDEKIFSIEEVDALFKSQFNQMGNMKPRLDRERIATRISPDGNHGFIVEEITLTLSSPEETNTIFMRASCVMEYVENRWKLTHWHTSTPVDTENDHWHMDEWKREKEKLQKLVDEQTADLHIKNRDLEIEVALEKVRARTMAMQSSDEFADVAAVLFDQIRELGGNLWGTGFGLCEGNADHDEFWFANKNGVFPAVSIPNTEDPAHKKMYEGWKSNKEFLALEGSGEDLKNHYKYMMTLPEVRPFFQKILDEGLLFPEWQQWNAAYFTHGYLLIITLDPYPDPDILKRFARVFDQTYTRFLDLKKAEAQAREAQVEAALERARAKSMLMQHSDEIKSISNVFHEQLNLLGIPSEFSYVWLPDEDSQSHQFWASWYERKAGKNSLQSKQVTYPLDKTEPYTAACFAAWANPDMVLEEFVPPTEISDFFDVWQELLAGAEKLKADFFPDGIYYSEAYMRYGCFGINIRRTLSEEEKSILKRFSKEFERAYTRFLDLKKAEEQAWEAEIQLALERVRARSLAMHKSEELADLSLELVKQVQALGIDTWFCAFNIYDDHPDGSIEWGSNGQGTFPEYRTPREGVFLDYYEAGQRGETFLINEIGEDESTAHYDYLCSLPGVGDQLLKMKDEGISFPESQIDHVAFFKYGYIIFITFEPAPESHDIFKRFAKVFEQTYTRFLDLQKAEDQTREAEIQLALERVRAKSMAMKTQTDLLGIIELFGQQLNAVDIRFSNVTFIEGAITKTRDWDLWSHAPESETPTQRIFIPYIEHPYFTKTAKAVEEYKKTGQPIHVKSFTKNEKNTFIPHYLKQIPGLPDEAQDLFYTDSGELIVDAFFEEITVSLVKGDADPYIEEDLEIFERFAKEFRQTYIRFLDIKKAEEQAREAQIESALEKVRSRSLAMHKSDELNEVVKVLFEKMTELEVPSTAVAIQTFTEDSKDMQCFVCGDVGTGIVISHYLLPYFDHPIIEDFHKAREKDLDFYVGNYSKKEKDSFYDVVLKRHELRDLPAEVETMIRESNFYEVTMVPAKKSVMSVNDFHGNPLSESQVKILKRFAKVFDQAYTRFLDLQKAEEQAREAKIEAALEKVRSRSLAMHNSDELNEVVSVLFEKLKELNIPFTAVGIATGIEDSNDLNAFVCGQNEDGLVITNYRLPYFDNPIPKDLYRALDEQSVFFVGHYSKEEKDAFYEYVIEHTAEFRHLPEDIKDMIFGSSTYSISMVAVKNAVFNVNNFEGEVLADKEIDIIKRFAKVFEQAYTRFLDLKKAEKQAREAQIEAALERVRSRSMGMQKSSDLRSVVDTIYGEFKGLGLAFNNVVMQLVVDDTKDFHMWITSEDGLYEDIVHWPYVADIPLFNESYKARESQGDLDYTTKSTSEVRVFFEEYFKLETVPQERKAATVKVERINTMGAWQEHTGIFVMRYTEGEYSENDKEIVRRFSKVFEQTYTRFLDLLKAEEQAREAQIEASLEKVRAQSMGMQGSEDLSDVASVMFDQMKKLGGELFSFGIVLCEEDSDKVEQWHNLGNEGMISPFKVPVDLDYIHRYRYDQWKAGEELFSIEIPSDYIEEHFDRMFELPSVKAAMDEVAAEGVDVEIPDWEIDYGASFNHGYLLVSSREPFEESHIFPRFAKVFNQAYTRFLDLQKAEAQAKEAEIQLALERVRARSMAMHKSYEVSKVVSELFSRLRELDIDMEGRSAFIALLTEGSKELNQWVDSPYHDDPAYYTTPYIDHPVLKVLWGAKEAGAAFVAHSFTKEEKHSYFKHLFKHTEDEPNPEVHDVLFNNEHYGYSLAFEQMSAIGIASFTGKLITDYESEILKRFAKVFEQAYIRFLDLQKAEAQAREAQIETALERIRSRTMAMQSSDELTEAVSEMFRQIEGLGLNPWSCGFNIFNHNKTVISQWVSSGDGRPIEPFDTPANEGIFKRIVEQSENDEPLYIEKMEGKKLEDTYKYMASLPTLDKIFEELDAAGIELPKKQVDHAAYFKQGYLMFITYDKTPEFHSIFKRFAKVFEQTYTRFLDLQKAEEQAREAKIEAALEKVRSRTMGMQSSDELPEVANMLFLEVQALGIPAWSCGYCIELEDGKSGNCIMSSEGVLQKPFVLPYHGEESFDEWNEFVQSDNTFFTQELGGKAIESHYDFMKSLPQLTPVFKQLEDAGLTLPTYQINHLCKFNHGFLLFITYEDVPGSHEVFKRFTNVFNQTYTRFLDLKKAEAQARKAEIEASLERVRAKTMSMQDSNELDEVLAVLCEQFDVLGIVPMSAHMTVFDFDNNTFTFRETGKYGDRSFGEQTVKLDAMDTWKDTVDSWKADNATTVNKLHFPPESLSEVWEVFDESFSSMPEGSRITPGDYPNGIYHTAGKHPFGYIGMNQTRPATKKEEEIVIKFANEFGRAYQRFLDLKKAEAQAREAQIEASLEKVRSRSLAMQHPDELVEVAQLLREEMGGLGVEELETSSIYLHDESSGLTQCWFTIKNTDAPDKSVTDQMNINLQDTWVGRQMNDFYNSSQNSTSILMKGEHRVEWIQYCEQKSDLFGKSEFYGETIPERTYHLCKFPNGFLGAASPGDISEESWDLMKRATAVFSFAYTRFSDLQKAEESARRAQQQASLDRVRADISSMRSAEDLNRVTPLIWSELTTLGIPFIRCGVFIIQEEDKHIEVYLSKPDGTSLAVMRLPFDSSELVTQTLNAWQQGSVYTQHWTQKEFLEWGRSMMERGQVSDLESYQGAEDAPESLHLHFIPFNQGMLYVGSTEPLKDQEINLSESLAKAFSIAYARYEDFVKLEKAKEGIEEALTELKATQSQLIQQEKLASLGQLTAGIAHEIKNPLNFVNNFSDLSIEIVEEIREEIRRMTADGGQEIPPLSRGESEGEARARGVSDEAKNNDQPQGTDVDPDSANTPLSPLSKGEAGSSPQMDLILDLLNDIETNLKTIHKHGSRADSIVKSMLQHSRGGDGKMEPTPLNPLIKEYVNLAFHGMRAGNDPINVDIDLQLDDEVGDMQLVSEDFSRVILNLVNNAFDAMREKLANKDLTGFQNLSGLEDYHPKLTVRTRQIDNSVTIDIEDNGPGIPDELKDKILQPFFTTKKGTDGTGLGLSITNDIIKAHGGELSIKSDRNGSTFIVMLPDL